MFGCPQLLKTLLARGTIAVDRAITIGDRETVMGLLSSSILRKSGAREISRYLLPPLAGSDYAEGLRLIDDAIHFTRSNHVDCILLALQWSDEHRRNLICERLQVLPIPVLLLPDRHVESIFSRGRELGREFTIEIQRPPLSSGELALKRATGCDFGELLACRAGAPSCGGWHSDQAGDTGTARSSVNGARDLTDANSRFSSSER